MYTCGFCKQLSQPGEPCKLVVLERRVREYPSVELPRLLGEFKNRRSRTGKGFETVREEKMCPRCAESPVHAHTIALSENTYGKVADAAKVTREPRKDEDLMEAVR